MISLIRRHVTRTAVPHPVFETDHIMVKQDIATKKLEALRDQKIAQGHIPLPERCGPSEEYNTPPSKLFELSQNDMQEDPQSMIPFVKVYAHFNQEFIFEHVDSLPKVNTNPDQELEKWVRSYSLNEMNPMTEFDTQFVGSTLTIPGFKVFCDLMMDKVPMDGRAVPLDKYAEYMNSFKEFSTQNYILHNGQGAFLDDEEIRLYGKWIRWQKLFNHWLDNRDMPDFTYSEKQFLKYIFNWPNSDNKSDFHFTLRPIYKPFDLDKVFVEYDTTRWENYKQRWRQRTFRRPRTRGASRGGTIFDRIITYVGSPEFKYAFDLPDSFVGRNLIIMIHMWLVMDRISIIAQTGIRPQLKAISTLRKFTPSGYSEAKECRKALKYMSWISTKIKERFSADTEKWLKRVTMHPAQRNRIHKIVDKYSERATYLLFEHFNRHGKTTEGMDTLIFKMFYPHRGTAKTYPMFVYQFSDYLVKQREFMQNLSYEDLDACMIEWDVSTMDRHAIRKMAEQAPVETNFDAEADLDLTQEDLEMLDELDAAFPEQDELMMTVDRDRVEFWSKQPEKYKPK